MSKIYLHFKEASFPEKTLKIGIPASWSTKNISDVIALFVKSYNKEFPEKTLECENLHLVNEQDAKLYSNDTVGNFIFDRGDYNIKFGQYVKTEKVVVHDSRPRCKNYGCNMYFTEEENHDMACKHHTGPPIFHDTMKCWSCCTDRKAFDFESFQEIKGCCVGRHSLLEPHVIIAPSPTASFRQGQSASTEQSAAPLKSIEQYNSTNPTAVTAASAALKQFSVRKSSRKDDGTARCQRPGCQKTFVVSENSSNACVYHQGQAVFHDTAKFWSCCPDRKCYDFDDFMKIKGCCVGCHDDGVIDL